MMKAMNYKPGWWGIYFIYCAIPIVIYIYYIYRRVVEESLFTRLMAYTTEHPWLWAVYALVIGLPIVAFFIFCCGGPTPRVEEKDATADSKKTDAATPDDTEVTREATPASKSQLDAPQEQAEPEDGEEEEEEDEDEEEEEEEEENEEQEEQKPEVQESKSSPRRRKPRKD